MSCLCIYQRKACSHNEIYFKRFLCSFRGGGRSPRLVRPSEESINLTIIGQTKTLKIQGFDHKWQDFWSDHGRSGRTGSAGPDVYVETKEIIYESVNLKGAVYKQSHHVDGPLIVGLNFQGIQNCYIKYLYT